MIVNRRRLVAGLAGAAILPLMPGKIRAQEAPRLVTVSKRTLDVKGKAATVYGLTGPDGKPGLDMLLGEPFRVRLFNNTDTETLIHWHGLTPPSAQDGVPMISQDPIGPGQSYDYDFINTRSGTHWMHSHMGLQEQQLLAAPLIVRETREPLFDGQEHVVLLHDFTFRDPVEILSELQGGGGAHAGHAMDQTQMDHSQMDHSSTGEMPSADASAMLNDIVYDAYLANDRTLDDPEVVTVEKGGQIRLRIINGAAASNMWIDLGTLEGELIAVDGSAIYPVRGSMFPLAIAQRADLRIRIPGGGGAFPVLFRPEGVDMRTGVVLATQGAAIPKISEAGDTAPALDLAQELLYRAVARPPDEPVTRTEMLMLTGGGSDYVWGLNGKSMMHDTIFTVRQGERISVMMHNMTGMAHPMHLHGHYFKVTAIGNMAIDGAIRDVVLVPAGETVTVTFDADNPGTWAFHCHHAYHMNAGMMGTINYSSAA
ncbi:multicopper oxidase family protein [Aestuariivirga sp.]|uniref:multicopper oxidase family protein n=1 Tax=Aestuariivirga sp. TaxID=2650926 RepID=UPI0035946A88